MTVFEVLNFNKELINKLLEIGFKRNDYKYIDLYSDYVKMKANGDKMTYVASYLSNKYSVSERNVYSIIKRFEKHCTFHAV